jgi:hexosaminidase
MKKLLLLLLVLTYAVSGYSQETLMLIPKPEKAVKLSGTFNWDNNTRIIADADAKPIAQYLQAELLKHTGLTLLAGKDNKRNFIELKLTPKAKMLAEAYQLIISDEKILVKAAHPSGLFAGVSSLLQLVRQQNVRNGSINLPTWQIDDKPLFAWRGFMLDESRHFFGKEKVKQLLDWMAFYKLNKFHWHLTDQPGWRLEVKQYPKLSLVGGIGTYSNPYAPAQYYTEEDIKEIVRYATERFIEVIPEIDMPGHATAANKAYPEFSGGGSKQHPEFTFNPGKEETYRYLSKILREVDVLFPSQKIHIGADEVHYGNENWNKDEAVQTLMKAKGLKDLPAVEAYFVQRMADSIRNMNNEVLAWDEVVGGTLSPENTTVFWWRHDKPDVLQKALEKGYQVVLCPRLPLYFDFVQDASLKIGRRWAGKYVPLRDVYQFPTSTILDLPKASAAIRGIQANLWTENLSEPQQLDFMIFPRIAALAEAAWTANANKDYDAFSKNLISHFKLFNKDGIFFFNPFNPKNTPEWLNSLQRQKLPDSEGLTKQESKAN